MLASLVSTWIMWLIFTPGLPDVCPFSIDFYRALIYFPTRTTGANRLRVTMAHNSLVTDEIAMAAVPPTAGLSATELAALAAWTTGRQNGPYIFVYSGLPTYADTLLQMIAGPKSEHFQAIVSLLISPSSGVLTVLVSWHSQSTHYGLR